MAKIKIPVENSPSGETAPRKPLSDTAKRTVFQSATETFSALTNYVEDRIPAVLYGATFAAYFVLMQNLPLQLESLRLLLDLGGGLVVYVSAHLFYRDHYEENVFTGYGREEDRRNPTDTTLRKQDSVD